MNYTLPCGCVIEYMLNNVGDYGYGGEIVDHYEIEEAELISLCGMHDPRED